MATQRRSLIRHAHVLSRDPGLGTMPVADILIADGHVVAVGPSLDVGGPVDEIINARGLCAVPGLINAHFHSPATLGKGRLDGLPLELFMLFEVPPLADAAAAARPIRIAAQLAAAEMLRAGVTAVQDDAFFVPAPTPEAIDALMSGYEEIGIRATVALDQPNVREYLKYPYLDEILPPSVRRRMDETPLAATDDLVALYAHLFGRWHGAADGRLRAAVSCSAPHRVTPDYMEALDLLSAAQGTPFFVHVLETRLQRVFGIEKLGCSLVSKLAQDGRLSERLNVIHAIWVDESDMDLLAEAGATVVHNPVCNLRLGSGVMPFRALRDRGVPIALGTDEALADDGVNLWQAMKLAGLIHTITDPDPDRWPRAPEVLDCLWSGGARAMRGADGLGRISPGAPADIALLRLDSDSFTPLNDLERQLVYCESGRSVVMTMVAGRIVMRDGVVTTIDEAALRAEARELVRRDAPALARAEAAAAALAPHYQAMYTRSLGVDVGFSRWAVPR